MFTNKQSLFLTGVLIIGFFIVGVIDFQAEDLIILDNLIVKIIFGILFLLIVINLFLNKNAKEKDDFEDGFKKNNNHLK